MPRRQRRFFSCFLRRPDGRTYAQARPRLEALETRALPSGTGLAAAYAQLPLSFEVNQGQTDPSVNFLSRGAGYTLFLTPVASVLSLSPGGTPRADAAEAAPAVLRTQLVGGNPNAAAQGLDLLPGASNYLIGNDPGQWHTGVANYGRVEYRNVYAGVNLDYYGNQRQLEFDFVVAAGANPGVIRLAFRGAGGVALDGRGDLVLHTSAGDVVERAPVLYQDGAAGRQPVAGRYLLEGPGEVGFQVGSYDPGRPLVIDPVLGYSTYLGGSGDDLGYAIAVDGTGSAYVTGYTASTDFPTQLPFQGANAGGFDVFVAKVNAAGTALVYSTYLGGGSNDAGRAIAVDSMGDAYLTGYASSTNFPIVNGFQKKRKGSVDAFVAKLSPLGNSLVYSTYLGGDHSSYGYGLAVDGSGDTFVTGYTNSTAFPLKNPLQAAGGGGNDAFVAKINPKGTGLLYSTYLGGTGNDYGYAIVLDGSGNIYVTGSTSSANFPTANPLQAINAGGSSDAFVAELNGSGSALVYSTYLGGSDTDVAQSLALDSSGNAYVTGYTRSTNFPTANALNSGNGGLYDAFVAEVSVGGTALVYSTYLGGSQEDYGTGIAVGRSGLVYVTGYTFSTNFPTLNPFQSQNAGGDDAFVTVFRAGGASYLYSTYLGGAGADASYAIAVDGAGNAYVTGFTASTDFPTMNPLQAAGAGGKDVFLAKVLNPQGNTPAPGGGSRSALGPDALLAGDLLPAPTAVPGKELVPPPDSLFISCADAHGPVRSPEAEPTPSGPARVELPGAARQTVRVRGPGRRGAGRESVGAAEGPFPEGGGRVE